jgi:hypothetical protein
VKSPAENVAGAFPKAEKPVIIDERRFCLFDPLFCG